MSVKNFYPTKPVIPFVSTKVEMGAIITELKKLDFPTEVKRAAYIIIRNETANGNSVINYTNLCGAQADSGRWPAKYDDHISGVCIKKENQTGKERAFLIFDTLATGISFVCDRAQAKGIFIGENVNGRYYKGDVRKPEQLADAYQDEWVKGYDYKPTATEVRNFVSMYNQSIKLFP